MALGGERVLVAERGLEVELVVGARAPAIVGAGEVARRIEVPIDDRVRLGLGARAVHDVGRELVVLDELVAGAPRQRVRQRHLRPAPSLEEVGHRLAIEILAVDRVAARTVVAQEAVAAEQRQRPALVAEVAADLGASRRAAGHREPAARARIGFLAKHDVDDAGDPFGIVARRRIRDHLHLVDHVGGKLREEVAELRRLHRARAPVDLHDDGRVAAQADDVVDVHVHRRHVAQHVERVAAARRRHVVHDVRVPIGGELHLALLLLHDDALHLHRHCGERDRTEVRASRCLEHGGELVRARSRARERGRDIAPREVPTDGTRRPGRQWHGRRMRRCQGR